MLMLMQRGKIQLELSEGTSIWRHFILEDISGPPRQRDVSRNHLQKCTYAKWIRHTVGRVAHANVVQG